MSSMVMAAVLQRWVSWPVMPSQITIGPENCPSTASGVQTSDAVLRAEDWQALFLAVFLLSIVTALGVVVVAYSTKRIGLPFVSRWLRFLVASAALALLAALAVLFVVPVSTSGCEVAETTAQIPLVFVLARSLVAAVHGALFYVLWSCLLSLVLGRILQVPRWYDNHRVPLPYFRPGARG